MSPQPTIIIYHALNIAPFCGVCHRIDDLSFRLHQNGDSSNFFCKGCADIPVMEKWLANGNILEWIETEQPQVRLI